MSITAAVCNSFKSEVLDGTHAAADVYKIALFVSAATLGAATTAYAATNEVANGNGYTTGGITLVGRVNSLVNGVACLDFTTDPAWANASFTARGALIYNSSKSNKAVAVLDFGADITATNATFTVTLPAADDTHATVRLA
jgi:hypothetical protein